VAAAAALAVWTCSDREMQHCCLSRAAIREHFGFFFKENKFMLI